MNNQLPNNLAQLQNLIKRDPESYKEEFLLQHRHYKSHLQLFLLKTSEYVKSVEEMVTFLAQVAHCYPEDLVDFPQELMEILQRHHTVLHPDMRSAFCRALILLRNKGLLTPTTLLELFFNLLHCQDKALRKFLQNHIITDIKNVNSKHKNAKLNTTLQNFMYGMLKDGSVRAAKMSLNIMIELYQKQVWNDAKTVNVIVQACFSKVTKLMVTALTFFLGKDDEDAKDSDDDSEDDTPTAKEVCMANKVNKQSRKRQKKLQRAKAVLKKSKKKKKPTTFNFSALHLIHDPQGMAEKLFKQLEARNERFEVKLMMMNLISRLIGVHQLFLFNFYPFLQRFLAPHQREVTKVLLYSAQAAHELVPPDVLEPMLMTIANNFVTERNSGEVMTVGLNAIRELCSRCPLVMNEDLLQDLAQYKTFRNKNVMMASRSLIQLYRAINPQLLNRKDRGKPTEATKELKPKQYGELDAKDFIPGAEALDEKPDDEDNKNNSDESEWETDSDAGSDGEWVDVVHSDDNHKGETSEEAIVLDPEERKKKAAAISQQRILTQEDFHKIRVAQLAKQVELSSKKGHKRKADEALDISNVTDTTPGEIVSLSAIERLHKKPKSDRETRLATVQAGREDREKFGRKKKHKNENHSTTNREKRKGKAFMMVKHKVGRKQKRSFRDKQISLRNALLKQKKFK